ncbi:hypothetical protein AYO41_02715 [Verrucomicrobia bacterium SCGC AG-212-E04]|nr:hypothetical protein AYO41_02715 [Verrucomicrobia bacterium SCGC AG-212-E04]
MRRLRNHLEHLLERSRQIAQAAQARLEFGKLRGGGQRAVEQQVGDLLKGGFLREVLDAVTAIGQAVSFLANRGDGSFARGNSAQAAGPKSQF